MDDIKITALVLGSLQTNCYLIANPEGGAVIIDPACDFKRINEKINGDTLKPVAVLLTHGHFDHIAAAGELKDAYGIPVLAGLAEERLMSDSAMNGAYLIGEKIGLTADRWLADGDALLYADFDIRVISTPGHTAGGVCYYFEGCGALMSGDTLFRDSYGRTDLPTGNFEGIFHSITQKLFALPKETAVYPGHGAGTAIGREIKINMINE